MTWRALFTRRRDRQDGDAMILIAGLGNPGAGYADNRHNIGFMAADAIVRRHGFSPWRARHHGEVSSGRLGALKALALKPMTYMNHSGRAVGAAARYYRLSPEQVIVIYDEIDLAPGRIRVKRGGGHGGHNGVRDIDAHIGREFWRVRLGIGHPGSKDRVSGHVLHDFAKADWAWVEPLVDAVAEAMPLLAAGDDGRFLNKVVTLTRPPQRKTRPKPKPKDGADAGTEPQDGI